MSATTRHPASLLRDPLVVVAIVATAINDHLLKGAGLLPSAVTGKLSDLAGLFFFPVLLAVLLILAARALRWEIPRRSIVVAAGVATAAAFGALNLLEPVNGLANRWWGTHTLDPTDLFCLPMVWISCLYMSHRWGLKGRGAPPVARAGLGRSLRYRDALVILLAATVSFATSFPRTLLVQNLPAWEVLTGDVRCIDEAVEARAWFAKTGREGAGLAVQFRAVDGVPREVHVDRAVMRIFGVQGEEDFVIRSRRAQTSVDPEATVYLPFPFNNDDAWRRGMNEGEVSLELRVDGEPVNMQLRDVRQLVGEGRTTEYAAGEAGSSRMPVYRSVPEGYALEVRLSERGGCRD